MFVKKSFLVAGIAIILMLVLALAYLAGKSSEVKPFVGSAARSDAAQEIVAQPAVVKPATPVAPKPEPKVAPPKPESVSTPNRPNHFTSSEQRLIDRWAEAMEWCRGSYSQSKEAEEWCPKYARLQGELNTIGICYGHDDDQSAADYDIHRCRKGSYHD